jgi:hypothetical protein
MTICCGSGSADPCLWLMDPGSCYFRHWPSWCQQKTNFLTQFFLLFEGAFTLFFKDKKSQNSTGRIQGFSYYFCMMIEGSGSGSIPLTSGSGSGRPKNTWIRIRRSALRYKTVSAFRIRIETMRIHNTGIEIRQAVVWFGSSPNPSPVCKLYQRRTRRLKKRDSQLKREGWGRSQIKWPRESMVRYKSLLVVVGCRTKWLYQQLPSTPQLWFSSMGSEIQVYAISSYMSALLCK